jgi:hypothetical protein
VSARISLSDDAVKAKGNEKTLTIEMLTSLACDVTSSIVAGKAPKPSSLVATLLSFGILSGVGSAWPNTMPLCVGLGGLVVLAEFVSSNGPGKAILKLLGSKWESPIPTTSDVTAYQQQVTLDAQSAATNAQIAATGSVATAPQTGSTYYTLPGTPGTNTLQT